MPFKNPHPLYQTWRNMRARCKNPKATGFQDYGGRGISICDEWNSFSQFAADMGPRPDGYSLDRIDNDKDYSPENCRWASRLEQQRNQRTTKRVTIEENVYLVAELAQLSGLKHETIIKRAELGMTYDQVIKKTRYIRPDSWRSAIEARVRKQLDATHCKRGHEWTPENTGIQAGGRYCKACDNLRAKLLKVRTRE